MDAGRRVVEPGAQEAEASAASGAQGAFRRDGAVGRQLSPLAGRARAGRVLDRSGGGRNQHDLGATGRTGNDLGGGGWFARVDRALWSAAVVVRGLEESLQASSDAEGAVARRRAGHAVWADVREVGDRTDRGQFAASERASGAAARNASGPAGEEAAAEADYQSRRGECVFATRISAGAQRAVCARGGPGGGLSPASATSGGAGPDFPAGERADPGERRGGAVPGPFLPTARAEPGVCASTEQGAGVRRAAWRDPHRVSRPGDAVSGDCRAGQADGEKSAEQ